MLWQMRPLKGAVNGKEQTDFLGIGGARIPGPVLCGRPLNLSSLRDMGAPPVAPMPAPDAPDGRRQEGRQGRRKSERLLRPLPQQAGRDAAQGARPVRAISLIFSEACQMQLASRIGLESLER